MRKPIVVPDVRQNSRAYLKFLDESECAIVFVSHSSGNRRDALKKQSAHYMAKPKEIYNSIGEDMNVA